MAKQQTPNQLQKQPSMDYESNPFLPYLFPFSLGQPLQSGRDKGEE